MCPFLEVKKGQHVKLGFNNQGRRDERPYDVNLTKYPFYT